jgi:CheY-like chemotaxis protein
LLAFSRRQPLAPEPLDLNVIVDDLERLLSRLVGDDVRISTEFYGQPLMIMADRGQLAQVLINLIVNARDAMPRGGTVTISTELEEAGNGAGAPGPARAPRAVLRVKDEGTGMDQQTRDHIFEPFFTTKAAGQGTGLGLSTVYGIVIVADGDITVESTLGQGTTFAVTLPLVAAEGAALRELPASAGGSETLLLVEDEDAVRAVARRALERAGYTVIEVELPNEALAFTAAVLQSIDLMLSDISMPGLSGPLLAQRLRVRRPDLPVLFMSGYSSEHLEEQYGLRQGEVLRKPFESTELYRAVRGMLDRAAPAGQSQPG